MARKHGGWGVIALAIVILQFAFPFLTLLSRAAKKSSDRLATLALFILIMRIVDVIWLIEPAYNAERFHLSWMDVVAPIAMGGLWISAFAWQLQKRPLIAINDPQVEAALETTTTAAAVVVDNSEPTRLLARGAAASRLTPASVWMLRSELE